MKSRKTTFLVLGILLWAVLCIPGYEDVVSYVWKTANQPVIVLDPGHGGIDGGAEGSDGTVEKDINLKIAKALKKQLEKEEIRVVMTRVSDHGLYEDEQEGSIRSLKTADMYERKRIIEEAGAELTVSIHLNSFTQDSSVKGAQVFYPSSGTEAVVEKSKSAAELIQKRLNETVNRSKPRTEMVKDDVFLLREATGPIVIAECGFLSNPEDLESLKTDAHQKKIAAALKSGICEYLNRNTGNLEGNIAER